MLTSHFCRICKKKIVHIAAGGNTFALDRNITVNFKPGEYMTQAAWKKNCTSGLSFDESPIP